MSSSTNLRFFASSCAPCSHSDAAIAMGQNAGTLASDRSAAFTGGVFDISNPFVLCTLRAAAAIAARSDVNSALGRRDEYSRSRAEEDGELLPIRMALR